MKKRRYQDRAISTRYLARVQPLYTTYKNIFYIVNIEIIKTIYEKHYFNRKDRYVILHMLIYMRTSRGVCVYNIYNT